MPIISISRGSYHRGRDVAHAVAEKLRYECISRDSLLENSEEFDIPEIKLMPSVKHAAQVLERFSFGRERFINYMSSSILRFLKRDNHIYHGLAGQFFVDDVKHVIKVRIIADLNERIAAEAQRKGVSEEQARLQLIQDDDERRKWAMLLYGIDISEASNYDMVLNISTMGVDEAASLIAKAAGFSCYQATDDSTRHIYDLALKSEVKAALFDYPQAAVIVTDGLVRVQVKVPEDQGPTVQQRMEAVLQGLDGLKSVDIRVSHYY
jgi:cytidylate kinase